MIKKDKIGLIWLFVADYKVFICKALDKLYPNKFYALHGQERPGTTPRDIRDLPIQNNINVKNKYWVIKGIEISWMPVIWWFLANRPKTIILGDGVRMLHNYVLHFLSKLIGTKVLYYTHGYNHQAEFTRNSTVKNITERIRQFNFAHSDALIVYTQANKTYLEEVGISTKIFVSHNTLETPKLFDRQAKVSKEKIQNLKSSFGVKENQRVILYLGRMVIEKEVNIFIDLIRELNATSSISYFGLAIGDGSLLEELKDYSRDLPIYFSGHLSGQDLADHLACSDCMFIPSHVGLAIVESFCAGKPFITCEGRHHSPEIDYLEHDVNGIILKSADPREMAPEVARMLENDEKLSQMSREAIATAHTLHPDASIDAFVKAIEYVNLGKSEVETVSSNESSI